MRIDTPEDEEAQAAAEEAQEQADTTCDEVNEAVEDDEVVFQPSPELKQLYRQAATRMGSICSSRATRAMAVLIRNISARLRNTFAA